MTKGLNGFNMGPEKGEPLKAGTERQVADHMAEFAGQEWRAVGRFMRLCAAATMMLASMTLAGCGSMSPSRLYDRAANAFSSPPASNEPYPNLATVPARPTPPSLAERQQVSSGLIADRNNAQYSEEVLRNPLAPPPGQLAASPALPPVAPRPAAPTAAQQPVAAMPPAPLPPADPAVPAGSPPVVRLVNGQLVASPGFFATEAPQGSAPPAAPPPAPVSSLAPGPVPGPATASASAAGLALNPGPANPSAPLLAANPTAAPSPAPAPVAAASAPANFSPDVVPEAPPPPPFALPARPAPPAPAPGALAALPPPQLAPQPAPTPQPRIAPPPAGGASAQVAVIYFADGKATLDADAEKVLDQVSQLYRLRGGTVRVLGYSGTPAGAGDVVRSSIASLNLAAARADAVANGLVRHGVRRDVIQRSGSNDAPPMLDSGRNTGLAGTRRAEIWLDY